MNNTYNLKLYGFYAPRYERLFGWLYTRPQRRAVALLERAAGRARVRARRGHRHGAGRTAGGRPHHRH